MPFTLSSGGGTSASLLYVEDVDAVFTKAVSGRCYRRHASRRCVLGRHSSAGIIDPFGHRWMLCTHIKDVSDEELQKGFAGDVC